MCGSVSRGAGGSMKAVGTVRGSSRFSLFLCSFQSEGKQYFYHSKIQDIWMWEIIKIQRGTFDWLCRLPTPRAT